MSGYSADKALPDDDEDPEPEPPTKPALPVWWTEAGDNDG